MPSITILPPEVSDQIAAGEVVERPASVVKELCENSLDAGAMDLDVECQDAGRKLIRVLDDGSGMGPEDLALSIKRHATSKIRSAAELWGIESFGFRGEALPSIASVSRLSIASRAKGSAQAWQLKVEAGQARDLEPANLARGTLVEARELFYNTPARLKFLKAASTENARVEQALQGLALTRPGLRLRLKLEQRLALDLPPARSLAERAGQVLGRSFIEEGLELGYESAGVQVWGWVGRPHTHRSTRAGQWLFVQGRMVEHRLLNFQLLQAYGSLIPAGRFPQALIFLSLPAGNLDVNVHPAKREVRFVNEAEVFSGLRQAVRQALDKAQLVVPMGLSVAEAAPSAYAQAPQLLHPSEGYAAAGPQPHQALSGWLPQGASAPLPLSTQGAAAPLAAAEAGLPIALAQLHRTYIVCQAPDGLVLVDQHAGHERVLYERILKRLAQGQVARQALLLPQRLSLGQAEASRLRSWLPQLDALGLELNDLGGGDFFATAIPALLKQGPITPLLSDLLAAAGQDEEAETDPAAWLRREAAARLACRAAVKAGDPLSLEEMRQVVAELFTCELPWACPHGRPPMVKVSLSELEKHFERR